MNHSCIYCKQLAVRVCIHPKCDRYPFICGDQCENSQNKAVTLHTHDGQFKVIRFEDMVQKIQQLDKSLFGEVINATRKKVNLLIGDLNEFIDRYELEMRQLEPQFNQKSKSIINNIRIKENTHRLIGKDISYLLSKKDIYQQQSEKDKLSQIAQTIVEQQIKKIEAFKIRSLFNRQEAKKHAQNGQHLNNSYKIKEALKQFQIANKFDPLQPKYVYQMGVCHKNIGNVEQAIKYIEQRISMGKKDKTLAYSFNCIGTIYSEYGSYQKALQYFDKAVNTDGLDGRLLNDRGQAYLNLNDTKKALLDFTKAIQLQKSHSSYYNRSLVWRKMGDLQRSLEDITDAIKLNPSKQYLLHRAAIYESKGNLEKARADKSKAQAAKK